MSKRVTSHSIVREPFAELIDHDEEDAQGVPEAALTKRNSLGWKQGPDWSSIVSES